MDGKEEQAAILKSYLKEFAVYFTEEEEKLFKDKIKGQNPCIIRANSFSTLKKAVCYMLLALGKRINYYYVKSNDIISAMLDEDEFDENYTFNDLEQVKMLIIYHPRMWRRNKILWETLNYLIETRTNDNKITVVITDSPKLSDEHGMLDCANEICLDAIEAAPTYDYNIISSITGSSGGLYD